MATDYALMASTKKLVGRCRFLGNRECSITLVMFSLLWPQIMREALAFQKRTGAGAREGSATYMAVQAGGKVGAAGPGREGAGEAEQGHEPQQRCAPGCHLRLLCCRLCGPCQALALQLRDGHLRCSRHSHY